MLQKLSFLIIITVAIVTTYRWPVQSQSSLRRLTNTPEHSVSLNPSISNNGLTIAFESTADIVQSGAAPGFHAFTMRPADSEFQAIGNGRLISPGISNDGTVVAFASTEDLIGENSDRNSEVYLFDGSRITQITRTIADAIETRLSDGNFQPELSGDARFIAFSTTRSFANVFPGIVLLDRETSQFTTIAEANPGFVLSNPKLSGDGSRVVFISENTADNRSSLFAFDTASHQTRLLAVHSSNAQFSRSRSISADGSRIVFSSESAPNQSQVFLYDERDEAIRQLTTLPSRSTDVDLSPTISGDGKRVAFATQRRVLTPSDGSAELYVVDLPTGVVQQITNAPQQATAEVVSSLNYDGSIVVFNFSRLLSGSVINDDFANNSEIYLSAVSARPNFGAGDAFNSAAKESVSSNTKTFAPDSLVNLRGNAISAVTLHANLSGNRFPTTLAGVTASVNNQPAGLVYLSSGEVTVVLPAGLSNGPTELIVTNRDGFRVKAPIIISTAAPGLFSFDTLGTGAILDATRLIAGQLDPTDGDLRLTVFATGVRHARSVSARLNGEIVEVEQVVPSNVPGLDEIHLRVPVSFRGAGVVTLSVVADDNNSNEVTFAVGGSPVRDLLINEFLADPADGQAGDANHDGTRSASADEFVELVNTTTRDFDLVGYALFTRTPGGQEVERHRFASASHISAGTALVVFGGGNADPSNPIFGGSKLFRASSGSLALSNSAGAIIFKNPNGETVCTVSYGSQLGLDAAINMSLTRSPDLVGLLKRSSEVANALFSPGTRLDGSAFQATPAVARIELAAPATQLLIGESIQFRATAFDLNNSALPDVLFSWQTNPASVASIDLTGRLIGLRAGSTNVVASGRGVSSEPFQLIVAQPTPTPTPSVTPTPSPTVTPTPTASPTPFPAGLSPVVISEFRTRGPNGASDEFIEIYNRTNEVVDISGWKIKGSSNSGSVANRVVIPINTLLPPFRHYLATHTTGYSGQVAGDQTYSSGLVNDGGIALTLPNDIVVDQVGLSVGSAFVEGMHLAPLPSDANQSLERKPGGIDGNSTDTDNNFSDFRLLTPSDPQNLSSLPTPGPTPSPSVTPSPNPTIVPTPSPSPSSSPAPTATPTPSPTSSPSPSPSSTPTPSPAALPGVRISQIYGGGGNSGAPFRNDFIEIFNAGTVTVDLSGWSVQYASATVSTWSVTILTSVVLSPGQYYLVQEASGGSNGVALPTPDATGSIALAATAGKVALVRTNTALTGPCPINTDVVDFVGYGSSANCFRGSGPAPGPSNTNAILRSDNGCADTQNNTADFVVGSPNPRNMSFPANTCALTVFIGDSSRLFVGFERSTTYINSWPSGTDTQFSEPTGEAANRTPIRIEKHCELIYLYFVL